MRTTERPPVSALARRRGLAFVRLSAWAIGVLAVGLLAAVHRPLSATPATATQPFSATATPLVTAAPTPVAATSSSTTSAIGATPQTATALSVAAGTAPPSTTPSASYLADSRQRLARVSSRPPPATRMTVNLVKLPNRQVWYATAWVDEGFLCVAQWIGSACGDIGTIFTPDEPFVFSDGGSPPGGLVVVAPARSVSLDVYFADGSAAKSSFHALSGTAYALAAVPYPNDTAYGTTARVTVGGFAPFDHSITPLVPAEPGVSRGTQSAGSLLNAPPVELGPAP